MPAIHASKITAAGQAEFGRYRTINFWTAKVGMRMQVESAN